MKVFFSHHTGTKPDIKFAKQFLQDEYAKKMNMNLYPNWTSTNHQTMFFWEKNQP